MLSGVSVMIPSRFSSSDNGELAENSPAVIALCNSPYTGIRRIRCYLRNGVARLEGHLPTYHQKQLAQEIVRRTEGVDVVENYILVLCAKSRHSKVAKANDKQCFETSKLSCFCESMKGERNVWNTCTKA